jgi:hypothetical protein
LLNSHKTGEPFVLVRQRGLLGDQVREYESLTDALSATRGHQGNQGRGRLVR